MCPSFSLTSASMNFSPFAATSSPGCTCPDFNSAVITTPVIPGLRWVLHPPLASWFFFKNSTPFLISSSRFAVGISAAQQTRPAQPSTTNVRRFRIMFHLGVLGSNNILRIRRTEEMLLTALSSEAA